MNAIETERLISQAQRGKRAQFASEYMMELVTEQRKIILGELKAKFHSGASPQDIYLVVTKLMGLDQLEYDMRRDAREGEAAARILGDQNDNSGGGGK